MAESKKRLVIVESPYAGDIERNLQYVRACMHDCLLRGEAPYASHALYTQPGVLDDTHPEQRMLGIEAGLAWGRVAEATVVYGDLGISRGMEQGIARAEAEGRPVERRLLGLGWEELAAAAVWDRDHREPIVAAAVAKREASAVDRPSMAEVNAAFEEAGRLAALSRPSEPEAEPMATEAEQADPSSSRLDHYLAQRAEFERRPTLAKLLELERQILVKMAMARSDRIAFEADGKPKKSLYILRADPGFRQLSAFFGELADPAKLVVREGFFGGGSIVHEIFDVPSKMRLYEWLLAEPGTLPMHWKEGA